MVGVSWGQLSAESRGANTKEAGEDVGVAPPPTSENQTFQTFHAD